MKNILILSSFLAAGLLPFGSDYVRAQEMTIVIIAMTWISYFIGKKVGALAAVLYWWMSIRAIIFFAAPYSAITAMGHAYEVSYDSLTSRAFLLMTLVSVVCCLIPYKKIIPILSAVMITNSVGIILNFIFLGKNWFMMDVGSLDGPLIAMLYGVVCFSPEKDDEDPKKDWLAVFYFFTPIIAILITKSSVAILALTMIFVLQSFKKSREAPVYALFAIIALCAGAAFNKSLLFNDSGRLLVWQNTWDYFLNRVDIARGSGTGTYWLISDGIAKINGRANHPLFNMLHNDWFQILFEGGLIAFTLSVALFLTALKRSFSRYWLFCSILVIGFVLFFDPMLRLTFSALCIGLVFRLALHKRHNLL